MRAVVQRVTDARISVDGEVVGQIATGLLVLLGVKDDDAPLDVKYLVEKIINLRIFNDEAGVMNKSVAEVKGDLLVVSQFTLYGDVRRGRRPSWSEAASPEVARPLYELFVGEARGVVEAYGGRVATGVFQAKMLVESSNDGPVTMLIDSRKLF